MTNKIFRVTSQMKHSYFFSAIVTIFIYKCYCRVNLGKLGHLLGIYILEAQTLSDSSYLMAQFICQQPSSTLKYMKITIQYLSTHQMLWYVYFGLAPPYMPCLGLLNSVAEFYTFPPYAFELYKSMEDTYYRHDRT